MPWTMARQPKTIDADKTPTPEEIDNALAELDEEIIILPPEEITAE